MERYSYLRLSDTVVLKISFLTIFLKKLNFPALPLTAAFMLPRPDSQTIPEPILYGLDSPPQHLEPLPENHWHYQTYTEPQS